MKKSFILLVVSMVVISACTSRNYRTGEEEIDGAKTAALVGGLALAGAAAYAVTQDDAHKRRDHHHTNNWRDDYQHDHRRGSFSPERGVTCYDYQNSCYERGRYSYSWTRRVYS